MSQLNNIQLSSIQLTNQLSISNPVSLIDTNKQELESSSTDAGRIESTSINSPSAKSSPVQQKCSDDITDRSQNSKESK